MLTRGVGTLRYVCFPPSVAVQWQPDGLTIRPPKLFLGAGILGTPPISLRRGPAKNGQGGGTPGACPHLRPSCPICSGDCESFIIYTYIYIYTIVCICMYIYIYYREREREIHASG